jgi:hypothetical protein
MKRPEIIAELEKRGIKYPRMANITVLTALLPKDEVEPSVPTQEQAPSEPVEELRNNLQPVENKVSLDDFEAFRRETRDVQNQILTLLEPQAGPRNSTPKVSLETPGVSNLQPEHQEVFEKYFDPTDGFSAELDTTDGLFFTIIVPEKFSNTTPAWKTMYKVDKRTKVLNQNDIRGGMEAWCSLVCKNLHYNKNIKTK